VEMELTGPDGHPMYARIERVEGETVTLNMNHPLAGAELHFDVKVVGLRDATEEEMDHGHAHGAHQH
ncbi:MAG: peptidylprolyl isomerase, partial [Anaerolineales bacterium]|nr:peptidylprolyl isomerase [Anaerolineales bacterium]